MALYKIGTYLWYFRHRKFWNCLLLWRKFIQNDIHTITINIFVLLKSSGNWSNYNYFGTEFFIAITMPSYSRVSFFYGIMETVVICNMKTRRNAEAHTAPGRSKLFFIRMTEEIWPTLRVNILSTVVKMRF